MSKVKGQERLLDAKEWWDELWKGMPQFTAENQEQVRTIYVHFRCQEDVEEFEKIVGQKIGPKIKYIWYPKDKGITVEHLRWVESLPDPDGEKEEEQHNES